MLRRRPTMGEKFEKYYKMPITLEKHFENLREQSDAVKELHSIYDLLKNRLEKELPDSHQVFYSLSYHDASHSKALIQAIERFLGEKRIVQLSPTDTFMLLVCAYAHDYGMVQTYDKVLSVLKSDDFTDYINSIDQELNTLAPADINYIKKLLSYLHDEGSKLSLAELYQAITTTVQIYLRPNHWRGVENLASEYEELFDFHLKNRFVNGMEGLVKICMCHGKPFDDVMKLHQTANGFAGDNYHPRFIAAMLRLGDLLDLDNNRFPRWMMKEIKKHSESIPKESEFHVRKHESITHLMINEEIIEIEADCSLEEGGYNTANLVNEWTEWLKEECNNLVLHWNDIVQPDFGRPPSRVIVNIRVNGNPYESYHKNLRMQMSQEHFMTLFEGFSIYNDKYVGIRELVQNAVDASLLQLWKDIRDNRYSAIGLSKDDATGKLRLLDMLKKKQYSVFGNYDITVEIIKDLKLKKVILTVKDKGIGITKDEIQYISDIGSSRENNPRRKELCEEMPEWLKPAGVFGIGLQSVFQITDCIEFFTRQPNQPELRVALYSFGRSKGRIEVQDLPPNKDGKQFFDNAVPGTNVKIIINPEKVSSGHNKTKKLEYFDLEFDVGNELDILYVEMCKICKERLKTVNRDYFNINFKEIILDEDGLPQKDPNEKDKVRWTYFLGSNEIIRSAKKSVDFKDTIYPLISSRDMEQPAFSFIRNTSAYYWDESTQRSYDLIVRPCTIKDIDGKKRVYFPEPSPDIYKVKYKFNPISNTESIYTYKNSSQRHAGFLSWNIHIFDGNPTKYLNIDRERLKDGAITEAELLLVRNKILKAWCSYFINNIQEGNAKKKSGANKQYYNTFNQEIGFLISLIMLFYQNVPKNDFQDFLTHYGQVLDKKEYVFGKEAIPLKNLWNQEMEFFTEYSILDEIKNAFPPDTPNSEGKFSISDKTLLHFPHRLIKIKGIDYNPDNRYSYIFKLVAPTDSLSYISLSSVSRFMDYAMAFDLYDDTKNIKYESVQKKVFKPDSKYKSLVLNCFPNTFSKGLNFSLHLDESIRSFILSPFDLNSARMLKDYLTERGEERVSVEDIKSYVILSEQYKKCVDYIIKKRKGNNKRFKRAVEKEYNEFIIGFCTTLKAYPAGIQSILNQYYHLDENG